MNFDPGTLVLHVVQSSSILELVEIAMSTFGSHALHEVCTFFNWATCSNTNDHTSKYLAMSLY